MRRRSYRSASKPSAPLGRCDRLMLPAIVGGYRSATRAPDPLRADQGGGGAEVGGGADLAPEGEGGVELGLGLRGTAALEQPAGGALAGDGLVRARTDGRVDLGRAQRLVGEHRLGR